MTLGPGTAGSPPGSRTTVGMDRSELITQITSASSLNDISSALSAARYWLAEHPQDEDIRDVMQRLTREERERLL